MNYIVDTRPDVTEYLQSKFPEALGDESKFTLVDRLTDIENLQKGDSIFAMARLEHVLGMFKDQTNLHFNFFKVNAKIHPEEWELNFSATELDNIIQVQRYSMERTKRETVARYRPGWRYAWNYLENAKVQEVEEELANAGD